MRNRLSDRVFEVMGGREESRAFHSVLDAILEALGEVQDVTAEVEVLSDSGGRHLAQVHVDHAFDDAFPASFHLSFERYHEMFQASLYPVTPSSVRKVVAGSYEEVRDTSLRELPGFLVGLHQKRWREASRASQGLIDKRATGNLEFGEWDAQKFTDVIGLLTAELVGSGLSVNGGSLVARKDDTDDGHVWMVSFRINDVPYEFRAAFHRKEGLTNCELYATLDRNAYEKVFFQEVLDEENVGLPYILGEMRKEVESMKRLSDNLGAPNAK